MLVRLSSPAPAPVPHPKVADMIEIKTRLGPARIVESVDELPAPRATSRLYADAETTSFADDVAALNPFLGHRTCGWALTFDDEVGAWYVPIRHRDRKWNLDPAIVGRWFDDWLKLSAEWVNHNVKFDAHFAAFDGAEGWTRLVDTGTRAKMIDSDRFSHGLKALCKEWLALPMEEEMEVEAYLEGIPMPTRKRCQDYGRVPGDVLGKYACMDVMANRELDRYQREKMEPEQAQLWETETLFTAVLYDMEKEGLLVDQQATKIEEARCIRAMLSASQFVYDELNHELIDSNNCCYDILVNQLGLPVLSRVKTRKEGGRVELGGPSFDKEAMLMYASHPQVITDERIKSIVDAILSYREQGRFLSLFVKSFQDKVDEHGRIHPTYNQTVRTGRMSCSDPNSQQMNTRAKTLIIPGPGRGFLSFDASQVEFRIIAHYIKDQDAIDAYRNDPDTDFHSWVSRLCGVGRSPGKTLNFATAYGAGKRRLTRTLMTNEELVRSVVEDLGDAADPKMVERACRLRAEEMYETYHMNLPGMKPTSQKAASLAKRRGYVRNLYGRRRHLSPKFAHKAFNSLVQGCAMDVIKERTNAIAPRYNSRMREADTSVAANVHDEDLFCGPTGAVSDPELQSYVKEVLEDVQANFRVPFKWDMGYSEKNWAEAKN